VPRRHTLGGEDSLACNDPPAPDRLQIVEREIAASGETVEVGSCSVTLFVLDRLRVQKR
jgi:hypothetical protein